jgi:phosphopantothenoylcysteine decarboxylase/phosphopantothenate--cysteine ligase
MHTEMWEHPAVQENLATLRRRGVIVVDPAEGRLAGGDAGLGRLADPADIILAVTAALAVSAAGGPSRAGLAVGDLDGRRVVVSAGGTREPIDPVRFISNRSSGKQGHALAQAAADRGATVTLATTNDPGPAGATVVRVGTAASMETAMLEHAADADVVVMAAAVADFRPKAPAAAKLSKADGLPEIVLEPTPDILLELTARRVPGQVLVGFAAETGALDRAEAKLVAKGVDLMVANDVSAPGVGFDHDTNAVTIMGRDGLRRVVGLCSKRLVAEAVLDCAVTLLR